MLVLGDEGHYHGRFPWVTASLVVINVVVFVAQVAIGPALTVGYALVPEEISTSHDLDGMQYRSVEVEIRGLKDRSGRQTVTHQTHVVSIKHYPGPSPIYLTLFTSLFLHADIFHLIGNMWFLLVFGRNVECAMNHGLFLAFYVACGLAAGLAHAASDFHSIIPCIGASGAISGVMGAYVSIHPLNTIKVWILFVILDVPALIVIGLWFGMNYVSAFRSLENGVNCGGVAYWAHLGGFAAGFVILRAIVLCLQLKGVVASPVNAASTTPKTSGAPDPFATFVSVQASKAQDQREQEKHGGQKRPS